MFKKVLIANRGEIALRILRTLKDMGIQSVTVYSTADAESMHVRLADESICIGPGPSQKSYLNVSAIIAAAEVTGADAIHPGVGFLAEKSSFARMVQEHGMTFIGPDPEHIDIMGDKIKAKEKALELGLPCVPGYAGDLSKAHSHLASIGFPLLIKAAHGGGGKGMQVVRSEKDFKSSLELAQSESKASFGSDEVYVEKYLSTPRHIEFQVVSDGKNALVVGERDCSIQRRHQKIWEEAPAPGIDRSVIHAMQSKIKSAMEGMAYKGLGTLEFLYENNTFYFIEMNTRLQVEHPITEMISGLDLVRMQIEVAAGLPLQISQEELTLQGHSIECRINAEDPENFLPSPAPIKAYLAPGGPHVRVDSHMYQGYSIPPYYDSLISKLIVYGKTRKQCLAHLTRALDEYVISGPKTLLPLHKKLAQNPAIQKGDYTIHWLEAWLEDCKKSA